MTPRSGSARTVSGYARCTPSRLPATRLEETKSQRRKAGAWGHSLLAVAPSHSSGERNRHLFHQVVRVLHAAFNAGVDDHVADRLRPRLGEARDAGPSIQVLERYDVYCCFLTVGAGRSALVDLGVYETLVRYDLAVLAVEGHLEAAVGHHDPPPLPPDAQVDVRRRA